MKKTVRSLSLILALVMIMGTLIITPVSAATITAATSFAGGSGTASKPWQISNASELLYFRNYVNSAKGARKYFILTDDIDLGGYTWDTSIGISGNHFKGELNGNGHTISNFKLTAQGFFGIVNGSSATAPATVNGLTLSDVTASFSTTESGIFVCRPYPNTGNVVFENCHVKDSSITTSATQIGGFVGRINYTGSYTYTFTNCSTDVTITTSMGDIGGFVGVNTVPAIFDGCSSTATVIPTASVSEIGGFVGVPRAAHTFTNCTSTLNMNSNNVTSNVGGFFGKSATALTMTGCTGIANVTTSATNVGAFVGSVSAVMTFDACTSVSDINASGTEVGGYIGKSTKNSHFTNCVSKGTIVSTNKNVGGYIGVINATAATTASHPDDEYTTFKGCANLTNITALQDAAGFVGHIYDSSVKIIRSYNAGPITATSTALSKVFIAQFVARASTNAYKDTAVRFSGNYVLSDVALTGGRIFANAVANNVPAAPIENCCMIAYGGSARTFAIYADDYGLDDARYNVVSKAELFLLAAQGKLANNVFTSLGDVVTVGTQEKTTRNSDGTYDLRLVAAISDTYKPTGFEITVSNGTKTSTSKVEVTKAYNAIVSGNEIITAPDGYYFITYVIEGFKDDKYTVDFTVYSDENTDFIKGIAGTHYVGTYDVGDGYTMEFYRGVTKNGYIAACDEVKAQGFTQIQRNAPDGNNVFKTYYNSTTKTIAHAYWTGHSQEMRIIYSPNNTAKPVFESTSGNNSLYDNVLLYQMTALDSEKLDGGMGFIIRLHDGRFIIIDGGNASSSYLDNVTEIYNFLKANAPDPNNIVIASWIITHGHGDHTDTFVQFANKYYNNSTIKLESVMFNPCETADQTEFAEFKTSNVYAALSSKYPNVPVYKALTGQKFTFSKTTIEILYTMSDFLPKVIINESDADDTTAKKGNGNVTTMVFMMDLVAGDGVNNNFMVLGDTTSDACNEISVRYGSYIESKYMQVSHHGLAIDAARNLYIRRNNSTKEFYSLINPEIALWPSSSEKVTERMGCEVNTHLVNTIGATVINASSDKADRTITVK